MWTSRTVLAICLLLSQPSSRAGQTVSLRFDHLGIEDGLSESIILCITQDSQGFMWFGTADGLCRYDGYAFKVFKSNPNDSLSISNSYVQALHVDRNDNLWIGSLGGLDWYDPVTETFRHYPYSPAGSGRKIDFSVQSIYQNSDSVLWVGTIGGGLSKIAYRSEGGGAPTVVDVTYFTTAGPGTQAISNNNVGAVCGNPDGNILAGTWELGVNLLDQRKHEVTRYTYSPVDKGSISSNFVRSVLVDRAATLWIGTESGGLNRFDPSSHSFLRYRHDQNDQRSIAHDVVRSLYQDSRGILWVGTDGGGLDVFEQSTDSFRHVSRDNNDPTSLRSSRIVSIYEDHSGTLWFGTWGDGVFKYSPMKDKFRNDDAMSVLLSRMTNKFVLAIFEDRSGVLWVGTHGDGMCRFDPKTSSFETFIHNSFDKNSIASNVVWTITEDSSSTLWIATDGGVDAFNTRNRTFRHYTYDPSGKGGLSSNFAGRVLVDSHENIWIATPLGMNKLDRGTNELSHYPYNLSGGDTLQGGVIALIEDSKGVLWVGLNGPYPFMRNGKRDTSEAGPSPENTVKRLVSCIVEDSEGDLWIGTFGNGFHRFNRNRKLLESYSEQDGLANNVVYGILEDGAGHLWLSTNKGISRFTPSTRRFKNYDVSDGLQSNEFNRGAFFKSREGKLYFGGINGINAFFPDSIKDNASVPPIIITGFKKFNAPVAFEHALSSLREITLRHTDVFISFDFTALDFIEPSKNQYAYRLDGFDVDWVHNGTRRFASYTNLSAGDYVFRVKGSNSDGVWNEVGTSIRIVITPPWWRTWWAYTAYFLAFVGLGFGTRWLVQNWRIMIASRKARYVSHYRLHEELGRGGMGTVYRAIDVNTKQAVALKLLHPDLLKDPENRKRLMTEGQLLSSFNHPHILKVYEVGETEERGFIAMEYLTGGTLREHLHKAFPLPFDEVKRITLQVASGLKEIHAHAVIHRDMKTGNVMLDDQRNVRIMDFGLSKSPLVTTMTTLGSVIGTLGYVAPEQVTNMNVDQRADIFSFGVILYELLTNQLPFKGENEIAVIHSIFNTVPSPPSTLQPSVPKSMDEIVMRCLAKEPGKRFASVMEIVEALEKTP